MQQAACQSARSALQITPYITHRTSMTESLDFSSSGQKPFPYTKKKPKYLSFLEMFAQGICVKRREPRSLSEKQTFLFLFFCLAEATSLRAQPAFCDSCSLGKVLDFIFRQFLVCPQRPAAAQLHGARPLCCYFTVSLPKFWVITSSGLPIDFHRVVGAGRKE